jgi:hypothetical protein
LRKPLNGGGRWSALGVCPTPPSSYSWYSVHVEGEYWVLGTGSLPATSPATPFEQIKPDYLLWGCSAGVGVGVLLVASASAECGVCEYTCWLLVDCSW